MNPFNSQINQRHSSRLKNYDYSSPGAYFVTICTHKRECLFGNIPVGAGPRACPEMVLYDAGRMITSVWHQIPNHYPDNDVDEFVVMPNHIHGIIITIGTDKIGQPQGVHPEGFSLKGCPYGITIGRMSFTGLRP